MDSQFKFNIQTLYGDLMDLCSIDDTFYYKDVRFQSISYRIFNYRLCSYAAFQSRPVALNSRGTMFNISNSKNVRLVSLTPEKFFNYEEGFGRRKYHELGRFGDKMEKLDGTLISTFLHDTKSRLQEVKLKSKQSLNSKQVLEAAQLMQGNFKLELEELVRRGYTVNMEYVSPTNHVYVAYPEAQLKILSIRCHSDGKTYYGSFLKMFLMENNFHTLVEQLVSFEKVSLDISHKDLIKSIYEQETGEGYVVEIIQPDQTSYLVKMKTRKYLSIHRDGENSNSSKSLFEAVINENSDDLKSLFRNDVNTLNRIEEMENEIRPKFNRMVQLVEDFHRNHQDLSKKKFIEVVNQRSEIKIYLPILLQLFQGERIDYKAFAMKNAKEIFGIHGDRTIVLPSNEEDRE